MPGSFLLLLLLGAAAQLIASADGIRLLRRAQPHAEALGQGSHPGRHLGAVPDGEFSLKMSTWPERSELPDVCSNVTLRPVKTYYRSDEDRIRCTDPKRKLDIVMAYGREPRDRVMLGMRYYMSQDTIRTRNPCFVMVAGYTTYNDTFHVNSSLHLPLANVVIEASAAGHEFPRT